MVYLDLVVILNFAVDLLLLIGSNVLAGFPADAARCSLGALVGSVYAAACFLPGMGFLAGKLWRVVFLGVIALCAYGINRFLLRKCTLFVLLSTALGGLAIGLGSNSFGSLILSAVVLAGLCALSFGAGIGQRRYCPVELTVQGRVLHLTALYDTGNSLSDPLTGKRVLVVDAAAAWKLYDLTQQELNDPSAAVSNHPELNLRLIPYCAVGTGRGMLVGVRPDEVRINGKPMDVIVAFAPQIFRERGYQALAGGIG